MIWLKSRLWEFKSVFIRIAASIWDCQLHHPPISKWNTPNALRIMPFAKHCNSRFTTPDLCRHYCLNSALRFTPIGKHFYFGIKVRQLCFSHRERSQYWPRCSQFLGGNFFSKFTAWWCWFWPKLPLQTGIIVSALFLIY